MKGATKVIMGSTLITVMSLAIVLALILVLLAELYCSLLLRWRHQLKNTTSASGPALTNTTAAATVPTTTTPSSRQYNQNQSTSPLGASMHKEFFMDQGTSFSPALPCNQNKLENRSTFHPRVLEIYTQESNTSPHHIGVLSPTSPSTSFATSPNPVQEISIQVGTGSTTDCKENGEENFVYISNPIYDNDADCSKPDTPFETPNSSSSCLENSGSSGDDEKAEPSHHVKILYSPPMTPPLSPIKKLPAQACSVS